MTAPDPRGGSFNSPQPNGNSFMNGNRNTNNGIKTQTALEKAKVEEFSKSLKGMIQQQEHQKNVNDLNNKLDAAITAKNLDIDHGFKTALNANFQQQCNAQNFGNIGFFGVTGAIEDVAKAGWFGWNNPFAMFSKPTSVTTTANIAVGVLGHSKNGNTGKLGQLSRIGGRIAAPIGAISATAFALVSRLSQFISVQRTIHLFAVWRQAFEELCVCAPPLPAFLGLLFDCCQPFRLHSPLTHVRMRIPMPLQDTAISVTTNVAVKCGLGIKEGHLRRRRRDGSEVNDMCSCFAISKTDADEDMCYASFTDDSASGSLEVFPSTYAEFCEEVRE